MTLLNANPNDIPQQSPWHLASGIVTTLIAAFTLMLMLNYFVH